MQQLTLVTCANNLKYSIDVKLLSKCFRYWQLVFVQHSKDKKEKTSKATHNFTKNALRHVLAKWQVASAQIAIRKAEIGKAVIHYHSTLVALSFTAWTDFCDNKYSRRLQKTHYINEGRKRIAAKMKRWCWFAWLDVQNELTMKRIQTARASGHWRLKSEVTYGFSLPSSGLLSCQLR